MDQRPWPRIWHSTHRPNTASPSSAKLLLVARAQIQASPLYAKRPLRVLKHSPVQNLSRPRRRRPRGRDPSPSWDVSSGASLRGCFQLSDDMNKRICMVTFACSRTFHNSPGTPIQTIESDRGRVSMQFILHTGRRWEIADEWLEVCHAESCVQLHAGCNLTAGYFQ